MLPLLATNVLPVGLLARVAVVTVVVATTYVFGYRHGHHVAVADAALAREELVAKQTEEMLNEIDRSQRLSSAFEDYKRTHRSATGDLMWATAGLRTCGHPPSTLVRLHDWAALGVASSESPGKSACAPGTVEYERLAATIVQNYAKCNEWREQLNKLIDWSEGPK